MKLLDYDYAALMLEIVLLITILLRRMIDGSLNKVFIMLSSTAILTTVSDIAAVTLDNMGGGNITAKITFHTIYLFLRALTSFFHFNYIIVLTDSWYAASNSFRKIFTIFFPILFVMTFMTMNLFTHDIFYIDEAGKYIRGQFFPVLYLINFYYLVYAIIKLVKYRSFIEKEKVMSLYFAFMIMIAAAAIQFIYPSLLVDMFSEAISLLYIFMMVQRPEEITDSVTGLVRFSRYAADIRRSYINKKPERLIMINICNFLVLRDTLGYNTITMIKRTIADRIRTYLRVSGSNAEAYYTGSGCFRIRFESGEDKLVNQTAEYLNEMLRQELLLGELRINFIACVCVVSLPEDIGNPESLIAFESLFDREYTGNVLYASEIGSKLPYDMMRDMDVIIENALADDSFEVYYQPIYSVKDRRFRSAEALLRLKTTDYGYISPELFIPAAEKSGAIHRIGIKVMEKVCDFVSSSEFKNLGIDYVEVNLSPVQCMENGLAKELIEIMKKYDVSAGRINFEITETAAGEIQNTILENICQLHESGASLSLDDFGTGYSNMTRIAALPFSIIKLDKSMTEFDRSPNMVIVVENMIKMIKAMNMKIVVEGVEDEDRVNDFTKLECEYIQGYYYSRPLSKDDFVSFISRSA